MNTNWINSPQKREKDIDQSKSFSELTPRQMEVLRCRCEGMTNRQASKALYIELQTIKNTLTSAYKTLGVNGQVRTKAGRLCYLMGLRDGFFG